LSIVNRGDIAVTPYNNAQAIQQIEEGHWEWLHHSLFSVLPNDPLTGALLTPLAKDGKHHQHMIGLKGIYCMYGLISVIRHPL